MMNNLFSLFDPTTNIMSINWISSIIGLSIIPISFWMIPSRLQMIWWKISSSIHKEFNILTGNSSGATLILFSLMTVILFNNFMGLFPYVFTSTSHMSMTMSLSLPMWISFMVYGWINNTTHMLAHLVPQGTPPILMPFMVCIETISNVIRPGTLAIRFSANMIAGHLLMTLLGNTGQNMPTSMISILLITQMALLTLESAVAMIQSYVFAVLSTLYSSEVN